MQYVQVVITDDHAGLLWQALGNAIADAADPAEHDQIRQLADFFMVVQGRPDAFPVTDPGMRRSIKKRMSRLKGPAQPKPNKRKRAQLRAQGGQKRTRDQKREAAELYNLDREAVLAQAEAERIAALGIVLPE